MYTYGFSVRIYDDKEYIEKGLVCGESYVDAVNKIESFYGCTLESISLECITDNEVIVIPNGYETVIELIKENHIW